jgi:hypothetical protein
LGEREDDDRAVCSTTQGAPKRQKARTQYGLRTSEATIHGRFGEIVADASFGDGFAVKFLAVPRSAVNTGALRNRYRAALAGGLRLKRRYGGDESTFHFEPANSEEARLALKLVGARMRRKVIAPSPAQLVARAAFASRRRNALDTVLA